MDRRMLDYLPDIMKGFAEFVEIAEAEQKTKEQLWEDVYNMFSQGYVSTETEVGARRWEKTLGIVPKDTDSIEVRNFRIRGKLLRDLPYTYRTLQKMLNGICGENGYSINMDMDTSSIEIKVALKSKEFKDEVSILAEDVIPAHILLSVTLMYNTHRMIMRTGKTHGELSQYTHKQIRETPFE